MHAVLEQLYKVMDLANVYQMEGINVNVSELISLYFCGKVVVLVE